MGDNLIDRSPAPGGRRELALDRARDRGDRGDAHRCIKAQVEIGLAGKFEKPRNIYKVILYYFLIVTQVKLVSVTKKGQVTIPEEVRRKLGIEPGAKLIVESVGSELALLKKVEIMDSLEELQRYCRKLAKRKGLTLKDIEEEIEAARAEIWKEKYEKRLGGL